LPLVRARWIAGRGDTELYEGRKPFALDDGLKNGETDALPPASRKPPACSASRAVPRVAPTCTQMHYARKGIVTPEMEYVAMRENRNARTA